MPGTVVTEYAPLGQRAGKVKGPRERATTVRFVIPSTGEIMCTRLSKVQRTLAIINQGSCLCEDFLSGECPSGNHCRLVHVPRHHLWERLEPGEVECTHTYTEGFTLCCYTMDMNYYRKIPSEYIMITDGSEKFIDVFNDSGDNFKEKFFLCPDVSTERGCTRGAQCTNIHCVCGDLSQFESVRTHIARADAADPYPRLPSDVEVLVFPPNGGDGVLFTGDKVLVTAGAREYEASFKQSKGVRKERMQHCAHFQNNKMCREGERCRFLHVMTDEVVAPSPESATTTTTPLPLTPTRLYPLRDSATSSSQFLPHYAQGRRSPDCMSTSLSSSPRITVVAGAGRRRLSPDSPADLLGRLTPPIGGFVV